MANSIILKKSSVAARVPVVGDLAYGELALNYTDGALYYKRSDNTIQNLLGTGVNSFNTRTGAVTLNSTDVTTALGFTPLSNSTSYLPLSGGSLTGTLSVGGNVGINIAPSSTPLDVNHTGSLTYGIRVGDNTTVTNSTGIYLRSTTQATIAWGAGGKLVLATSGGSVTRFTIGAVGQLGIGAAEDNGTLGQVLTSQGANAAPIWAAAGGGGAGTQEVVLNDISSQFDGVDGVFNLMLEQTPVTTITDAKNLEVVISGRKLSPHIKVVAYPWFEPCEISNGFKVRDGKLILPNPPAIGESALLVQKTPGTSTVQTRKYPYSATTVALGD